ncbi:MAG: hypothetical protein H0X33_14230 [Taibaiella sp.]|nr:hypothetical protein [Taibaiella sp.]
MPGKGGARVGAGRKSKDEEDQAKLLAQSAITKKYGSLSAGFESLLDSDSDMLKKFVYEHAFGKPKEKVELSGSLKLGKAVEEESYE